MQRKWLAPATLLALPVILFLPLNYAVRSRQPVTVDIGRIARSEEETIALHELYQLLQRHPRAATVEVRWQSRVDVRVIRGYVSYNRIDDMMVYSPAGSRGGGLCEISEDVALNWAQRGKIPKGSCSGNSLSPPVP